MKAGDRKLLWISIDGVDGSGKTSISTFLAAVLRGIGLKVKHYHTPKYDFVRHVFETSKGWKGYEKYIDEHIFTVSHHMENLEMQKWRGKFDIVISQRFWIAQFPHRRVDFDVRFDDPLVGEFDERLASRMDVHVLDRPDIMIYIDLKDYEKAFERLPMSEDKREDPDYLAKVAVEYNDVYSRVKSGVPPFDILQGSALHRLDGKEKLLNLVVESYDIICKELSKRGYGIDKKDIITITSDLVS